jgi:hypothetical protein
LGSFHTSGSASVSSISSRRSAFAAKSKIPPQRRIALLQILNALAHRGDFDHG